MIIQQISLTTEKGRYQWLQTVSFPGTHVSDLYIRSSFSFILLPFLKCRDTFINVCVYTTDTYSAQEENSGPYTITTLDYQLECAAN